MKKHYQKLCMTPLGFEFEGALLEGSVPIPASEVKTMGQTVEDYDFSDDSFTSEWEDLP